MNCKFTSTSLPIPHNLSANRSKSNILPTCIKFRAQSKQESPTTSTQTHAQSTTMYKIKFQTLQACKLGISRYPDFEYNAEGGIGTATGEKLVADNAGLWVNFDVESLYIPALTGSTTRFLKLPLPPFLKIEIAPEVLNGSIDSESGKVELEFKAKFWFSIGSFYKAPPLMVKTTLTSEESKGSIRRGKGERMDGEGRCRLVGVATVDPVDNFVLDSFLGLPTECIADLNAQISVSS